MNYSEIIAENKKRRMSFTEPYDPVTGEGSDVIPRKEIKIEEFGTLHIPADMYEENGWVQILSQEKSYKNLLENGLHQQATPQLIREIDRQFFLLRIKYDFEFWAIATVKIKDKITSVDIPFLLNRPQRKLLKLFEQQRREGKPIRVILLKARQWGGSTLTQIYMAWIQLVHKHQWNSVIAAHVKDSSSNIRAMYSKLLDNYPSWILNSPLKLRPFARTQNISYIQQVNARVTIGSAEKPDSVRGADIAMVHFSEVALYPDTKEKRTGDLIASISSSIPLVPYSVIVMESTAQGVGDYFHTEYENAKKGESDKTPIFIPWYDIEMYQTPVDDYKRLISSFTDYEWYLWESGATLEAIEWYRNKRKTFQDAQHMMSEFPSNDVEAFANTGERVFDRYAIHRMRENTKPPCWRGELQSDTHSITGKDSLRELSFKEDTTGLLKVWEKPDTELDISNRYIVSVDIGGRSHSADWSVISVIDRYWTMYGGKPEIVASWRGHIDHDILAWKATQIALWYNTALLVFESNTLETEASDQGDAEYILDLVAASYENLYARQSPPSQIKEGAPARWGFHTNRTTKSMVINNQIQIIRDNGYIEREEEVLDEHDTYEKKKNGAYGAIEGKHDDLLMSRAIGLYISGSMDPPKVVNKAVIRHKKPISEASF
jgi:hypothetical protein